MDKELVSKAMDQIEKLLSNAVTVQVGGGTPGDVEHYINNARQIALSVKTLVNMEEV